MLEHVLPTLGPDAACNRLWICEIAAAHVAMLSRSGLLLRHDPLGCLPDAEFLALVTRLGGLFGRLASPLMPTRLGGQTRRTDDVFGISVRVEERPVRLDADGV